MTVEFEFAGRDDLVDGRGEHLGLAMVRLLTLGEIALVDLNLVLILD